MVSVNSYAYGSKNFSSSVDDDDDDDASEVRSPPNDARRDMQNDDRKGSEDNVQMALIAPPCSRSIGATGPRG